MSIAAIEQALNARPTLRATVDLPEPDPPAIPMISGRGGMNPDAMKSARRGTPPDAQQLSQSCIGEITTHATMKLRESVAAVNAALHVAQPSD
jgi:hypothetical protein